MLQLNVPLDPKIAQWLNLAAFALSSLALASWWQDLVTAKTAAELVGGLNWVVSVMNFVLHGMPAPTQAVKKVGALLLAILASLFLLFNGAKAADMPKQAAKYGTPNVCNATDCSGWIVFADVAGVSTNLNVIGNGVNNSLAGGGQYFGAGFGYQYWDGKFYVSPTVFFDYSVGNAPAPSGMSAQRWMVGEVLDIGAPLASLFGGIQPASTTGFTSILLSQTLSPFVTIGAAETGHDTAVVSGAGLAFWINQNWLAKGGYRYFAWNNNAPTNEVYVSIAYKF